MKVESEKVGLKLNIQKTKIAASGPITSQREGQSGAEASQAPGTSPAACSFPGENARSWEALGEARPGQSSLSAGAVRYRAWAHAGKDLRQEEKGMTEDKMVG